MVGIVQWVGNLFNIASTYVGADREIRVDTSNYDLRLHDGVTPGGHRLMNETNSDAKYQLKNAEIDGIGPYAHDAKGVLTRRGDGEYVLRVFTDDLDQEITITNPDGYSGNFRINLANTITRAKTFNGALTLNGDVGGSGTLAMDADFTGKTVAFDDDQIPVSKIAGLAAYISARSVPIGAIILWHHAAGSIPSGYALCDGTNGTPDMRNAFVVGAGGGYSAGATGGATTATPTINGHALTVSELATHSHVVNDAGHNHPISDPGHTHSTTAGGYFIPQQTGTGVNLGGSGGTFTASAIAVNTNTTGISITTAAANVFTDDAGAGAAHTHTAASMSILPPYYAEYYIKRIS
jgi:hypothetical protein